MLTVDDLRTYVGGSATDDAFLTDCLTESAALVTTYIGDSKVPVSVMDNAVLQVASELFNRRSAPGGVSQFAAFDGTPMRVGNDPMRSVYALLDRYSMRGV